MIDKNFRIPKTVRLPGVTVQVMLVSPSRLPKDVDADWVYGDDGARIRINKETKIRRQRYLLYHELYHAIHDIMHMALQDKEVAP